MSRLILLNFFFMKIYSSSLELLQNQPGSQVQVVAEKPFLHMIVGNFDGLHLGHQALIKQAQNCCKKYGGQLAVYSFNPHPQSFFKPQGEHTYLESRQTWREHLAGLGVDILIEEKFTKEFSQLDPDEFLDTHWGPWLNLKSVIVGVDYKFGRGRKGDKQKLNEWCERNGILFFPVEPVLIDGERVSTSKIKAFLQEGNVEQAAQFLGREFGICAVVQKGEQRGRKLGFPTLNQVDPSANLLKRGVYLTNATWRGRTYAAITNVGVRPTVHDTSIVVMETHIVESLRDLGHELYGETVEVRFEKYIREEKKFPSLQALQAQIQEDVKIARKPRVKL